ncbi:MerR family transcriptional regulator [Aquisphaera insulae]|uniref:MerR family transcriptional regulator n=1 Tax=Aquisphaera insulae TaxID=2712864 RepID=UPI0013ECAD0A|nr:MerR family transcriptional regulator [Aquisphaera insulae]
MNTQPEPHPIETGAEADDPPDQATRPEAHRSPTGESPTYSIAAVSKFTGISCHTLRVWERRYGYPVPGRTATGHRRYSLSQVHQLKSVERLSRATGQSVGQLIAGLSLGEPDANPSADGGSGGGREESIKALVDLLTVGDGVGSEREYERLCAQWTPIDLVDQVIEPGLVEAGEGWYRRDYPIYKERLITVFIRRKLSVLIDSVRHNSPVPRGCLLVGTVQGDRHEGGSLILNLVMELRGWRVFNLGTDLPVREFTTAIRDLRPSALALSFTLSRNIKKRFQELKGITEVPVFVGGRSIVNYQSLARAYGLIPLPGPIRDAAPELDAQYQQWLSRNSPARRRPDEARSS